MKSPKTPESLRPFVYERFNISEARRPSTGRASKQVGLRVVALRRGLIDDGIALESRLRSRLYARARRALRADPSLYPVVTRIEVEYSRLIVRAWVFAEVEFRTVEQAMADHPAGKGR